MCLYPRLLKNKKYQPTKKNKGKVPQITDPRIQYVSVGCGKCIECMKKKKREWQVRLNEEIKNNMEATFVTLTFNNESLNKLIDSFDWFNREDKLSYNEIAIKAVRLFLERWRKKHKKSLKHWLITELGHNGTERIHLHGILFTNDGKEITEKWAYGFVYIGQFVNEITINYIIKYVTKIDPQHKNYTPVILTSPGIGKNYTKSHNAKLNQFSDAIDHTNELYHTRKGLKLPLPIYYRNKIYTDEEREELWIQKLDKEERYIMGEKIKVDTPEGEKLYEELREYHRKQNIKMGYNDGSKDWNKWLYNKHNKRIKDVTKHKKNKSKKITLRNKINKK